MESLETALGILELREIYRLRPLLWLQCYTVEESPSPTQGRVLSPFWFDEVLSETLISRCEEAAGVAWLRLRR